MLHNTVKKLTLAAAVLIVVFSAFPRQQITEESLVVNIEVPVRVFDGDRFVDDLKINDFEIYEDGVLQKLEAVYLVKKRTIERSEELSKFVPKTSREFYLFFEVNEYMPKLGEAVEFFIENVFYPGDHLVVVTPLKTYRLRDKSFEVQSKAEIVKQLKGILRKDAMIGSADYRNTLEDLSSMAKSISSVLAGGPEDTRNVNMNDEFGSTGFEAMSLDMQLNTFLVFLQKLEKLRTVDEDKLEQFASSLKEKDGQKNVFLFYQREYIPEIDPGILNQYLSLFQDRPDLIQTVADLFEFYQRSITFDVERIKKMYSDSSINMHFLFITKPPDITSGVRLEEHSEDIFSAFREMALASGGFVASASNPSALFKKAVHASENYYLLYYIPKNYKRDGKFKELKVKVKGKKYKVVHRAGYFAN